jgi:hypothetical protein
VKILCFAWHSRYVTPKQKFVAVAGKQESRKVNPYGFTFPFSHLE